jgi:hypothetical protein
MVGAQYRGDDVGGVAKLPLICTRMRASPHLVPAYLKQYANPLLKHAIADILRELSSVQRMVI